MGLFDKLFGRDSAWYVDKCNVNMERKDYGEAMRCIKQAIELAKTDEEKQTATAKKSQLTHEVYHQALEQAKSFMRCHNSEAAQNAIDRAARHVQTDEERDELNQLIEKGHQLEAEEKIIDEHVDGEEHVTGLDTSDKWNLYVTALPFDKAQHYDELGDAFKKAWIALQEGLFVEAIEGLEAIYEKHADDPYVMVELGRAYYGKGDLDKADDMLKKADEARQDIETKLLRAEIQWALKRFDVAEEVLQAAHDLDPDNNSVLARIAQHGLIAHDFESGIPAIEALIEKVPNDVSVQRLAGRIYLESGDDDKALEAFETVNRLYWQVNPQTKQLTFDKNAAAAAAGLYIKKGENYPRAIALMDAIRANTKGEEHVAVCIQMADIYEKMEKKAKRDELLTESLRFMDDLLEAANKGPEAAMLQLQYAEVADRTGDAKKCNEMLNAAYEVFEGDAKNGHPLAAFYVELIDDKRAGKPFPPASEMQERLNAFAQKFAANRQMSQAQASDSDQSDSPNMTINVSAASTQNATNEDAMHKMAALASQMQMQMQSVEIEDGADSESESESDSNESSDSEENAKE